MQHRVVDPFVEGVGVLGLIENAAGQAILIQLEHCRATRLRSHHDTGRSQRLPDVGFANGVLAVHQDRALRFLALAGRVARRMLRGLSERMRLVGGIEAQPPDHGRDETIEDLSRAAALLSFV